ncbi:uncharacterized protein CDV56_104916 [Aspergillus thermomutatus]|uniref:Uncharacterized protein n=1 Tax=Aspergillus thermomutatus TaxID=41047 RepID=A0A397GST4_ASPTH|nr:uncharacterized protein CDV56_104916 [Aspergillus thermomutatus]RHZ52728.1 hypothetical protein CDV56_104916 [Aspergillus thermomutatus]
MHFSQVILPFLSLFSSQAFAASPSSTQAGSADILYWPVASSQPSVLARISYDPASLTSDVVAYSPPSIADLEGHRDSEAVPQDLVRVGLFTSTPTNPKQWVGSLTSLSSLAESEDQKPTLRLHLGPSNEIYHVSLVTSSPSAATSSSAGLNIELLSSEAGPLPHLNRPVVVGPDGTNPEEIAEKTFFQK